MMGAIRKYTRRGDQIAAYECTRRKCKWVGTSDQWVDKPGKDGWTVKACPSCGNEIFNGLTDQYVKSGKTSIMAYKQTYDGQMNTGLPLAKMLVPDTSKLTPSWVTKITRAATDFFAANPEYNKPEVREFICHGDISDVELSFKFLDGFTALQEVLQEYRQLLI